MKQNIYAIITSRKLYFSAMLLLILIALLLVMLSGNAFAYISSNETHPFWLNVFFINYTFMGNGLFVICLSLVLIFRFKRKQLGIAMLYVFLFSGIVVQLLKNRNNILAPTFFIEQGEYLFSKNVLITVSDNFISSHTIMAFALATVLISAIKNPNWQLPLLFAALLLGYSRIYLAQHSLFDILVSAMIGTIVGITTVYFAYYYKRQRYNYKKFLGMNGHTAMRQERNIQTV